MDLEISVDFESQNITIVIDSLTRISADRESDGTINYSRLSKIESEDTQEIIKQVCELIFSIEDL